MDCIFCKIVKGDIPSFKIWEDSKHIAIFDIHPNTKGMTLIITKTHYDSYLFEMPDKDYSDMLLAAKKVSRILDEKLGCKRTAMVAEGMGVNHAHIKLYPMHGVDVTKFGLLPEKVYFKKYPGYITTLIGPEADMSELAELSKLFRE
jgi:histidine triad (HIT) family protein